MIEGIFGWSLIFELLVFYYALNLWLTNVDKRWVYLIVGIIASSPCPTLPAPAGQKFSNRFDLLWREIFGNFGFH